MHKVVNVIWAQFLLLSFNSSSILRLHLIEEVGGCLIYIHRSPPGGALYMYLHIYLHPPPQPAENRSVRLTYSIRTGVLSHFCVLWFSFTSWFLYLSVGRVLSAREKHKESGGMKAVAFEQVLFLNFFLRNGKPGSHVQFRRRRWNVP